MDTDKERQFNARYSKRGSDAPDFDDLLGTVMDDTKEWVEGQIAYSKLSGSEKLGKLSGELVVGLILALFICGMLFMCSVALALWLGHVFNSVALGFLSTAGIFLLLGLISYFLFGTWIRNYITLSIINTIHEKDPTIP